MPQSKKANKISVIRFIYLYLITAITFIVFLIGAVNIVDTIFKTYVFHVDGYEWESAYPICEKYNHGPGASEEKYQDGPGASEEKYQECIEQNEKSEKTALSRETKRRLSVAIAQILVAFPLWIFHWRIIEKDRKNSGRATA
jgi:hypothetical protein